MITRNSPRLLLPFLGPLYAGLEPLTWPVLRIMTGLWLIPHGAHKLFGVFESKTPVGFEALSQAFAKYLGLPGFLGPLTALIEFFGGILLVLGLLTRPVAAIVFVELLIAVLTVHLPHGFFAEGGGFEYPLMWCILAGIVAIRGGGALSIDRALGREF